MKPSTYDGRMTVGEAQAAYLVNNGFDAPDAPWVTLPVGPFTIKFPNTPARIRAVWLHDLHHVAAEYATDWTGEGEIGAFEIGAGCAHHRSAWALNFGVFGVGVLIAPRRTWQAFVRGRHATSLYVLEGEFHPRLLEGRVSELRARLGLDRAPPPPTTSDRAAYAAWLGLMAVATVALPVTAIVYGYCLWSNPPRRPAACETERAW